MGSAKRLDRELAARERWPRERLEAFRDQRVAALLAHARERSPFWRERLAGVRRLEDVEPVGKTEWVERFDDIVCDRSLRASELLAHVERADGDALWAGRHRVIATSGSTGRKGLFVWDRADWIELMAGFLRHTRLAGTTPRIPRLRLAFVGPSGGGHMSRRMAASVDVGAHRLTVLPVTLPLDELKGRLEALRPDVLAGFPSVVALLAEEQIAGRLRIAPARVTTSSELRTPEMAAAIRAAWGVAPIDAYAMTEAGFVGVECEAHRGLHLFEDLVVAEPADRDGRPVPDGETGDQVLITSLVNRTQPTIRLAVTDMVAIDPEPCPCGRTLRLLRGVEGRSDDVLHLPGRGGARVAVHPMQFAPVAHAREVREFQVVQEGRRLRVRVALHPDAEPAAVAERLSGELERRLRAIGVVDPQVAFEAIDGLERDPARMGKVKLVVAG